MSRSKSKNRRKTSEDTFGNDLNYSYESMKSNSVNNSQFKFTISIMKDKKSELSSRQGNSNNVTPTNKENAKKNNLNITFKKESISPKRLFNVNIKKNKSKDSIFKINQCKETISCNNSNSPIQNDNFGSLKSESFVYLHKNTEKIEKDNSSKCFITLKNINDSFSKKIRKKMKKRKKLQRLKKLLKLKRLKIKKNSNKKSNENIDKNDNCISFNKENNFNYSIYSSNNKISSQISDFTEGDISSSIINTRNFHLDSYKIELSESFEIKSSYRNINLLTKGEMIQNHKYKKYIENLIKNQYKKYKANNNNYRQKISLNSNVTKNNNKNNDYMKFYEGENETGKDEAFFSEGKLISLTKKNQTNGNLISEESNNLSNKKLEYNNYQATETFENPSISFSNKKVNQKFKCSSKFFEKSDNWEKGKINDSELKKQELINLSKNEDIELKTLKNNSNGKFFFYSYSNKIKKQNNNSLNGDNSINYLNKCLDYNNKDLNSNALKNSLMNKSNNYNSFTNVFDKNNNEDESIKNCIIF